VKSWQVIFATLVIFGAGVVTGGVLVSYSDRMQHRWVRIHNNIKNEDPRSILSGNRNSRDPERFPQPVNIPQHGGLRTNFVEKLHRDLKLSAEQHQRIEKIVAESQERTKELWKQAGQPIRNEVQETKEKIRAELTPEQRQRFEELTQRLSRPMEEGQLPDNYPHNPRDQRDQRRPVPPQNSPNALPPIRVPQSP